MISREEIEKTNDTKLMIVIDYKMFYDLCRNRLSAHVQISDVSDEDRHVKDGDYIKLGDRF